MIQPELMTRMFDFNVQLILKQAQGMTHTQSLLSPPFDGHISVAGIDSHGNMSGEPRTSVVHKGWFLEGNGSQDNPVDTQRKVSVNGLQVPDSSTQLQGNGNRRPNLFNNLSIFWNPFERSIQIHQMKHFRTLRLPFFIPSLWVFGVYLYPCFSSVR